MAMWPFVIIFDHLLLLLLQYSNKTTYNEKQKQYFTKLVVYIFMQPQK